MDDAQAILWLLKRPDVDIKAITVTGTGWCSLASGLANVFNLLAFMGRQDIPVTWGSPYPLYEVESHSYGCLYAKSVPVAPIGRLWSDTLMGLAHCFPKSARDRFYNPDAPARIAQLLAASHGPIDPSGARLPNHSAEYNAYGDPEALARVVRSGVEVVLVPLDATARLIVNQTYLDESGDHLHTPEAHWVHSLLLTLQQQMGPVFNSYSLWDPYAAAVLVDQQRYASEVATVPNTVVTQAINASEAGRTMPDPQGTPVTVVLQAADLIFGDLFGYYNASRSPVCTQTNSGVWH